MRNPINVIASAATQSIFLSSRGPMDCFAALAMTVLQRIVFGCLKIESALSLARFTLRQAAMAFLSHAFQNANSAFQLSKDDALEAVDPGAAEWPAPPLQALT
jgi:hypothetical protein